MVVKAELVMTRAEHRKTKTYENMVEGQRRDLNLRLTCGGAFRGENRLILMMFTATEL